MDQPFFRPPSKQPLPANARCVFHGVIFDVYQWEQLCFDGKTRTFEKLKRPDTVVVIPVTKEGMIVYSFQEQPGKAPFLATLGGRVDEGEDVLDAAKRELREESGFEAESWELLSAVQPHSKIDWTVFTWIAHGCRRIAQPDLDGGEKIELREASCDDYIRLMAHEPFGEIDLKIRCLEALLDPAKMQELRRLLSVRS